MSYNEHDFRSHVKNLQTLLNMRNFTNEINFVLPIDGIFSEETEKAVKLFEKEEGFSITGEMDYERYVRLCEKSGNKFCNPRCNPIWIDFDKNIDETKIYILQAILQKLSLNYKNFYEQELSGNMDEATIENIRIIQKIASLPPTGVIDNITFGHITRLFN